MKSEMFVRVDFFIKVLKMFLVVNTVWDVLYNLVL